MGKTTEETIDFTAYLDAPIDRLLGLFADVKRQSEALEGLERLGILLRRRVADLLRCHMPHDVLVSETRQLGNFLNSAEAEPLRAGVFYCRWLELLSILSDSVSRNDIVAARTMIQTRKAAQTVLQIVDAGHSIARKQLQEELLRRKTEIDEWSLSRLLTEMCERDLLARNRQGREIWLELGSLGETLARENRDAKSPLSPADEFLQSLANDEQLQEESKSGLVKHGEIVRLAPPGSLDRIRGGSICKKWPSVSGHVVVACSSRKVAEFEDA